MNCSVSDSGSEELKDTLISAINWLEEVDTKLGVRDFCDSTPARAGDLLDIYYRLWCSSTYEDSENIKIKLVADDLEKICSDRYELCYNDLNRNLQTSIEQLKTHPLHKT